MGTSRRRTTRWLVPLALVVVLGVAVAGTAVALSPDAAHAAHAGRQPQGARTWQGPAAGVQVLGGAVRPGVPTIQRFGTGADLVTVTVVPARPGPNLVRFDASQGWDDLRAGTDPQHLGAVVRRAATPGRWAVVDLTPGTNTLYVAHGTDRPTRLTVEAGADIGPAAPDLAGGDGSECLAAVADQVLAGADARVTSCPSSTLTGHDKAALLYAVGDRLGRGVTSFAIRSDLSTRSQLALRVVRQAIREHGAHVVAPSPTPGPHSALIVLSGWQDAARWLTDLRRAPSDGTVLAPWLRTPGVTALVTQQ